jgi:hypothetical protein
MSITLYHHDGEYWRLEGMHTDEVMPWLLGFFAPYEVEVKEPDDPPFSGEKLSLRAERYGPKAMGLGKYDIESMVEEIVTDIRHWYPHESHLTLVGPFAKTTGQAIAFGPFTLTMEDMCNEVNAKWELIISVYGTQSFEAWYRAGQRDTSPAG